MNASLPVVTEVPSALDLSDEPWTRSWFYVAPGEWGTFAWIGLIHAASVAGLAVMPLPSAGVVALTLLLGAVGGLGTTVCYHRALSHRAVRLNPLVEQVLIFCACFNGSSHPLNWVASHRQHHAHSDRPGDVSSPRLGGFWWSHLRWLWQAPRPDQQRWCRDMQTRAYRFWSTANIPVVVGSLLFGWLISPVAWLWLGPLRLTWALHAQCTINSISHMGPKNSVGDYSRNVPWLTPVIMGIGENWHLNHHVSPGRAQIGYGRQLDLGWLAIRALQKLRLAGPARCEVA
jgi:stearoyl-CoA desaturase (delta-9 desaturase)